jgi:hypothetical protein
LEEHVSSIFRVKEYLKQETSMKQATGRVLLAVCLMLITCLEIFEKQNNPEAQ